jgi:hypothetical protein
MGYPATTELNEACPEAPSREGGVEADRQMPGLAATDRFRSVDNNLQIIEYPASAIDKVPTCRGRPDAAACPLKQHNPELLLQMSDFSAEIGLLHTKQICRFAKAACTLRSLLERSPRASEGVS